MNHTSYISFILSAALLVQINLCALVQSEIDFKKMADLVVQVVDDQEEPVAGATVYPYAMRGA